VTMGTNGMYTCIVKELDTDWKGVEQIRRRLAKLLPPEMMPHFVVARWINGQLSRPHLIWMLRSPVYWNPPRTVTYKTGRTAQFGDPTHVEGSKAHKAKKLLDRVNLGLTKLLLECGADPAQTNCAKMKNPLSPHMSVGVLNGDNLTDLRAFRSIKGFDMAAKFSDLNADAEALNNVRPLVSQPLFHATVLQTTFELNKAKAGKDVDYVIACRDKSDLEQWIYDKVFPTIFQEWGNFRSVERMVRSRAKRFATTHKPGALVPKPGKADVARGRYRHLAPENMTAENAAGVELTRQAREAIEKTMKAFGGRIVAKQRHAKTMWEVGKFLVAWRNAGMPMEKTAVIKRLADENILGKSASYARWDEIAAIVAGDSATLHTCKKAADSSFRSSSRKSYHGPHQDSEAPASGDPANNQSDPGADRPSEPPHQTDDRTSASDGREEHAPQRRGFRIVEGSNVGENPAQHQPIFIVVRNAAEFDYAHAA
ncbi:MAG: hypothetical protein Q7T73_17415, partial [Beijerinckiaceae bacterium]|nr:hypothetical protein [Beijerinckiaceae bacterium]